MSYTIYSSDAARAKAESLARGSYQESLTYGHESWSGATLRGKAKKYSGKYHYSRQSLMARMRSAGLTVEFQTVNRRKVLFVS